jgi:hypothetical protein
MTVGSRTFQLSALRRNAATGRLATVIRMNSDRGVNMTEGTANHATSPCPEYRPRMSDPDTTNASFHNYGRWRLRLVSTSEDPVIHLLHLGTDRVPREFL